MSDKTTDFWAMRHAALSQCGSGWVWLCVTPEGNLSVVRTCNQDTPLPLRPLLCCDLWEHAYYPRHRTRRGEYFDSWWLLIDWPQVSKAMGRLFQGPLIANVGGFSLEEYAENCRKLDACEQVSILEVNISCPNVHCGGKNFGSDPKGAAEVTRAVKAVTGKPVFMPKLDILYMTRVQKERFFNEADYIRLKDTYVLTPEKLIPAKEDLCILHPLPRVNEIAVAVDDDPRACYFKQVRNGKFIRMKCSTGILVFIAAR